MHNTYTQLHSTIFASFANIGVTVGTVELADVSLHIRLLSRLRRARLEGLTLFLSRGGSVTPPPPGFPVLPPSDWDIGLKLSEYGERNSVHFVIIGVFGRVSYIDNFRP